MKEVKVAPGDVIVIAGRADETGTMFSWEDSEHNEGIAFIAPGANVRYTMQLTLNDPGGTRKRIRRWWHRLTTVAQW